LRLGAKNGIFAVDEVTLKLFRGEKRGQWRFKELGAQKFTTSRIDWIANLLFPKGFTIEDFFPKLLPQG